MHYPLVNIPDRFGEFFVIGSKELEMQREQSAETDVFQSGIQFVQFTEFRLNICQQLPKNETEFFL